MNTPKTLFDVLQVSRYAESKTIDDAYRSIAKRYHPDINKDPQSTARMKEINEAYEVLKDPVKRERYRNEIEYLEQEAFKNANRQAAETARKEAEQEANNKPRQNTSRETPNYPSYALLLDAATKSFEDGDYDNAHRIIESAIALYPNDERANKLSKNIAQRRAWLIRYTRLSESFQNIQSQARILQSEWPNSQNNKFVYNKLFNQVLNNSASNESTHKGLLILILICSAGMTYIYSIGARQTALLIKLDEENVRIISRLVNVNIFFAISLTIALISGGLLLWSLFKKN
jgi:curved DNA-binding protein CbpA